MTIPALPGQPGPLRPAPTWTKSKPQGRPLRLCAITAHLQRQCPYWALGCRAQQRNVERGGGVRPGEGVTVAGSPSCEPGHRWIPHVLTRPPPACLPRWSTAHVAIRAACANCSWKRGRSILGVAVISRSNQLWWRHALLGGVPIGGLGSGEP